MWLLLSRWHNSGHDDGMYPTTINPVKKCTNKNSLKFHSFSDSQCFTCTQNKSNVINPFIPVTPIYKMDNLFRATTKLVIFLKICYWELILLLDKTPTAHALFGCVACANINVRSRHFWSKKCLENDAFAS